MRFLIVLICWLFGSAAFAQTGDDDAADTVRFAQVAALEGPAGELGRSMQRGLLAAFEEANARGGVHGARLILYSLNDGYEPNLSSKQVLSVIEDNQYVALIGMVGTPTTLATQPLATAADVPFIGAYTGAAFLREPSLRNVVNVRASYAEEAEALVSYLVDERGFDRIGILYQDDGFGAAGYAGVSAALQRRNLRLTAEGAFQRNTIAVRTALLNIRRADPQAVITAGAYQPTAEFIRLSGELNFAPVMGGLSFGSSPLAAELGREGEGYISSQVVPSPWDRQIGIVADYQDAMDAIWFNASYDFVSLEGYIVGRVAIHALQAAGPDPSRAAYLAALQGLGQVTFDGVDLRFGRSDNQGMDQVFLKRLDDLGAFQSIVMP